VEQPPLASSEVTAERLKVLRQADAILQEIRLAGLYDAIWQAFTGTSVGSERIQRPCAA
jgi:GMP synthase PP-ATPase subunit